MPFPSIDGKDDLCDAFAGLIVISEETQMCTMSKLCVNTSFNFFHHERNFTTYLSKNMNGSLLSNALHY